MFESIKLWHTRNFKVISRKKAEELNLKHHKNIHGDERNLLGCKEIWKDQKNRKYRVCEV